MSLSPGYQTGRSDAPSVASTTTLMGQLARFDVWTGMPCQQCQQPRSFRALGWKHADKRIGRAQCMVCGIVVFLEASDEASAA